MDFSNFTGLQAAVADFLNRPDLNDGGQIAGFVVLAEATMRRTLRRTTKVASLTLVSGADSATLPDDLAELASMTPGVSVALPRGGVPLDEVSFAQFAELRSILPATGIPRFFAVVGNTVNVAPAPADAYLSFQISYISGFTPLSDAVTTNPILEEAPDAYLYGALVESAPFLEHDERLPMWKDRFDTAIAQLNEKRQREEFGASLKKARLPVSF